jgi:hypothetical protein
MMSRTPFPVSIIAIAAVSLGRNRSRRTPLRQGWAPAAFLQQILAISKRDDRADVSKQF